MARPGERAISIARAGLGQRRGRNLERCLNAAICCWVPFPVSRDLSGSQAPAGARDYSAGPLRRLYRAAGHFPSAKGDMRCRWERPTWPRGRLPAPSWICTDRIVTLNSSLVIKQFGRVSERF